MTCNEFLDLLYNLEHFESISYINTEQTKDIYTLVIQFNPLNDQELEKTMKPYMNIFHYIQENFEKVNIKTFNDKVIVSLGCKDFKYLNFEERG